MSEQSQGAMVHEMLGRFIEEAVNRAVQEQMSKTADWAEKRAEEAVAAGVAKLDQTLDRADSEIQNRIRQIVEQSLHTLTTEAERNSQHAQETRKKTLDDVTVTIQESLMQMTQENETLFHRRAEEWMNEFRAEQSASMSSAAERLMEGNTQRMQEMSQKALKSLDDVTVTVQESLMQMTQENETLFRRRAEEWMSQFRAEQSADMTSAVQAQFETMRRGMLEEEQRLGTRTAEAERLMEGNTQRMQEMSQKALKSLDDVTVTVQESLMQMTQENETLFHRRAEEWMSQFRAEQSADMSLAVQAQLETVRRSILEEERRLGTLTAEAERLMEANTQRMQQLSQNTLKALDDVPGTIQEFFTRMTQENETLFHQRAEEWMSQFRTEQTAGMTLVLQAQLEAVRRSILEEVAQSAKAICDRNLFDIRSDFENHVTRSFHSVAERLTAPLMRQ
jgi:hypothetical protein